MNYLIEISDVAEQDIRESYLFYANESQNLGHRFEKIIKSTILKTKKFPLKNQIRYNDVRVIFTSKFPFGIHYRIQENRIIIIAVFHTSLSPRKWQAR